MIIKDPATPKKASLHYLVIPYC